MDVCRVCLAESPEKDIESLKTANENEPKSSMEIFEFCLSIQITEDSKISTKLCTQCYQKIVLFYKFKLVALMSDQYLRALDSVVATEELARETDANSAKVVVDIKTEIEHEPIIKIEPESDENDGDDNNIFGNIENIINSPPGHANFNPKDQQHSQRIRGRGIWKKKNVPHSKQVCLECGKSFANLNKHMKKHMPIKQRPRIPCIYCPKTFSNFPARRIHYMTKHLGMSPVQVGMFTKRKPHKCEMCDCAFTDSQMLNSHRRQMHFESSHSTYVPKDHNLKPIVTPKEKKYSCQFCDVKFEKPRQVKRHQYTVHVRPKILAGEDSNVPKPYEQFKVKQEIKIEVKQEPASET